MVKIDKFGDRSEIDLELRKFDPHDETPMGKWNKNGWMWNNNAIKNEKKNGIFSSDLVITTVLVTYNIFSYPTISTTKLFFEKFNLFAKKFGKKGRQTN